MYRGNYSAANISYFSKSLGMYLYLFSGEFYLVCDHELNVSAIEDTLQAYTERT